MIKTTVGALSNPGLQMALQKLNGAQVNTKTAYRFKKLNDELNKQMNRIRSKYTTDVVDKFGVYDEKKQLVPDQKPWGFKLKDGVDQKDFDAANDEFHKREVIIDRIPLSIVDLNEVKISAAEISALGVFFADPEEISDDDKVVHLTR